MTWWEYIERHTPGCTTQAAIAKRVGMDQTQVSRWRTGQQPQAASAVQAARNLGREPLEALVAAGYLTPAEAKASVTHVAPVELTDEQLVDLVRARLAERAGEEHVGSASTSPAVKTPAAPRKVSRARGRSGRSAPPTGSSPTPTPARQDQDQP